MNDKHDQHFLCLSCQPLGNGRWNKNWLKGTAFSAGALCDRKMHVFDPVNPLTDRKICTHTIIQPKDLVVGALHCYIACCSTTLVVTSCLFRGIINSLMMELEEGWK